MSVQLRVFVYLNEAQNTIQNLMSKKYIQFLLLAIMMLICVTPVFAVEITDDMVTSLTEFYDSFLPVVNILALIFGTIAVLGYVLCSTEKGAENSKKWGQRVVIGWLVIVSFPYLMIGARNLLGNSVKGTGIDEIRQIRPGTN